MGSGRRYENEPKLNIKKIICVIIAIAVIVMFIVSFKKLLQGDSKQAQGFGKGYFSVYRNGKWGVINQDQTEVIPFEYDEMIIVPDSSKELFIVTYDVDFASGTYKTKALNNKKEQLFKDYETVEAIDNFDEFSNIWYEKNVLKVKKDGKYGLINFTGNEILKCEYDEISSLKGTSNSLILTKDGKLGLSSNVGDVIIKPEYKEIKALGDDYSAGYIVKNDENKFGFINCNKKVVLDPIYEEIKPVYTSNKYVVKEAGKLKVFELPSEYTDVLEFAGDNVIAKKGDKAGVVSFTNEVKIPFDYQALDYIFDEYYIAKKENKYGVIDLENKVILNFEYANILNRKNTDFIEIEKSQTETEIYDKQMQLKLTGILSEVNTQLGYINIRINNEQKYYNFKFEEKQAKDIFQNKTLFLDKKDGKYGYKNKEGKLIVDYIYDDAKEQNQYGYCSVKKGNLWGSLNKDGNVSLEPSVNLDDHLVIDFIGKWHLGQDLNMNYYTQ
jgi:hypothetical protein